MDTKEDGNPGKLKSFHNSAKNVHLRGHRCEKIEGSAEWSRKFVYIEGLPKEETVGYYQPDMAG